MWCLPGRVLGVVPLKRPRAMLAHYRARTRAGITNENPGARLHESFQRPPARYPRYFALRRAGIQNYSRDYPRDYYYSTDYPNIVVIPKKVAVTLDVEVISDSFSNFQIDVASDY